MNEVRFSTRRAAKVTTYNEDDDLGLSDEAMEETTPAYYYTQEDEGPAIDQVLNFRLKDGAGTHSEHSSCTCSWSLLTIAADPTAPDKQDYEFFVRDNHHHVLSGRC